MRNAKEIINLIQNKPQFSKLSKYKRIQRIQVFTLNHPSAKQGFHNNIQSIKSALNFHTPQEGRVTKKETYDS